MKFVAYETCDKLIWISGESYRDLNTIRKQVIPKNNMNRTYPSSTLSFVYSPYKDTCDILSEYLVSHIFKLYSSKIRGMY